MTTSSRQRLTEAAPVLGAWISMTEGQSLEVMTNAGYDFLILDIQHGAMNWDRLLPSLQIIGNSVPALVRVGWRDAAQIMRAVDLGAAGVIVPMVSTVDEAQQAVRAIRYPPLGDRSFGPVRNYYAAPGKTEEPLCLVMIETAEAMRNLNEIAATPGIDGLFVGPMDLALSLGHAVSMTMPQQVLDSIDQVVAVCEANGIIAGCASLGMANAEDLLRRGIRLVALGSDMIHLRRGAQAEVEQGSALKKKFIRSSHD